MCGIVGVANQAKAAKDDIIFGLKALEYRGYDSAGAVFSKNFEIYKTIDSIETLSAMIDQNTDAIGIGHTRWATHGAICLENAHPIIIKDFAIVHNGILENAQKLCKEIGYAPKTKTDTEILLALFLHLKKTCSELDAIAKLQTMTQGSYAVAILQANAEKIFFIKKGLSPLILAKHDSGYIITSDEEAVNYESATVFDLPGECYGYITSIEHKIIAKNEVSQHALVKQAKAQKLDTQSYLETEIAQQISIFEKEHAIDQKFDLAKFDFVTLIGCGSAYIACTLGKLWLAQNGVNATAEIASEWNCLVRNSNAKATDNQLAIFLSQSGETADTLSALRHAKFQGMKTLAIVNKVNSAIAKEADDVIFLDIGEEKSVASSKAFTAMLLKLWHLIDVSDLANLAQIAREVMQIDLSGIVRKLADAEQIIIVGKSTMYSIALEGALKIQELTYLNVHAFACGELKHGYIALIDAKTVALVLQPWQPDNVLHAKTGSCIAEIQTRNGHVLEIGPAGFINIPAVTSAQAPFVYAMIMQRLAFELASALGRSIDKPRNLAKAVTVE